MERSPGNQPWPQSVAEEVSLMVSRWTAARPGSAQSLWAATPSWLNRYIEELLNAHAVSLSQPRR